MNSDSRDWVYRHYVANSLMMLPQNKYFKTTLEEMLEPQNIDTRTGLEIVDEVIAKTGIKIKDYKPATE